MFRAIAMLPAITITIAATTFLFAAPCAEVQKPKVEVTFDKFLDHLIAGRGKQALDLMNHLNQRQGERIIAEVQQVTNLKDIRVIAIYASKKRAIGISSLTLIKGQQGNLVLQASLDAGNWRITDIDFRKADQSNDKLFADLGQFWYRNSDARPLRLADGQAIEAK